MLDVGVAAVTVLPAALLAAGTRLDAGNITPLLRRLGHRPSEGPDRSWWSRVAARVARRPLAVAAPVAVLLVFLRALLDLHPRYTREPEAGLPSPPVGVPLPGGGEAVAGDAMAAVALSEHLGRKVSLWPRLPAGERTHYLRAYPEDVEQYLKDLFGVPDLGEVPDLSTLPPEVAEFRPFPARTSTPFPSTWSPPEPWPPWRGPRGPRPTPGGSGPTSWWRAPPTPTGSGVRCASAEPSCGWRRPARTA
nr:hypothetical protein [Streptomyces sp. ISL-11]